MNLKLKLNRQNGQIPISYFCVCLVFSGFVIGGQDESLRYLNDVEVLAPGFDCSEKELNPFPIRLKWASAAFINGQTIGKLPFTIFQLLL